MHPNIDELAPTYGIKYDPGREPVLGFNSTWVQEAENHKAIFDYFYQDVIPDESLCIAYAKQVPFVEDNRRVVIGIGHVKRIVPAVEHKHTDAGSLRSMIWETMVCHSIREDHKDGFVIPYQQMMEYAQDHPDFDMSKNAKAGVDQIDQMRRDIVVVFVVIGRRQSAGKFRPVFRKGPGVERGTVKR